MSYMNPDVLDAALNVIVNATPKALHICSAEPIDYNDVGSVSLGYKINPTISAPQSNSPTGRRVEVAAIADGVVTASGTATHWALTDATRLLAAQSLAANEGVTQDNAWTMDAFDISIPDPA